MQSDFFEKHIHPVRHKLFRFACRITGNAASAEDVVQDVFAKIWKQKDTWEDIQNWEAWCMTLTRNLSINQRKKDQRAPSAIDDTLLQIEDRTPDIHSRLNESDVMRQVKEKMMQLPENQRLCMHLRDVEEMSYAEISETLNMNLVQVKSNIHRARKTMRNLIDRRIFQ